MSTLTWDLDIIGPSPADLEEQHRWETALAWGEWAKYCCVERHGVHLWMAELNGLTEDYGVVTLYCAYCPATVSDLFPDAEDTVFGEIDGIPVENGRARSLLPYVAPVTAVLHNTPGRWYGPYWEDPEVWVEVTSRPGCVAA